MSDEKKVAPKKSAAKKASSYPPFKEMIKQAILQLKERNGSSRQAIKKYIHANYHTKEGKAFDHSFNNAIKKGVESGDFLQPKSASGRVKLASAAKAAEKKPKAVAAPKKAAPALVKKVAATKKSGSPKKAAAMKKTKTAAPKAKADTKARAPSPVKKAATKVSKAKTASKSKKASAKKMAAPTAKKVAARADGVKSAARKGKAAVE